jgi:dihydropteroate synthase
MTCGTLLMGIVNATPDSFSDGGQYFEPSRAVDHALQLAADGAAILDIGGESTRPYSEPVAESEELKRVIPVIERLVSQTNLPISIDTSKPKVAAEAMAAGAEIINDITGLTHPDMVGVAKETGAGVCVMHMQGTPQTMQDDPQYQDVVGEIMKYLSNRRTRLLDQGIGAGKICLDPGIGFGKTHRHNLELVRNAKRFLELESPILIGHSRKGFIGKLLKNGDINRDAGTLAITLYLAQAGIHIIRVHEVTRTFQSLQVDQAIRDPGFDSVE